MVKDENANGARRKIERHGGWVKYDFRGHENGCTAEAA